MIFGFKNRLIEIGVFISSTVVMALEILGFHMLAPYFGLSLTVSSNLIGLVLIGLSLGYFYAGKISKKVSSVVVFSNLILLASVFIGLAFPFREWVGGIIASSISKATIGSFLDVLIFLLPVSFFLGMILPYAITLRVNDLSSAGKNAGRFYLISLLGSVFGTLLAGFAFTPAIGMHLVLEILAILLLLTAYALWPRHGRYKLLILAVIISLFYSTKNFEYKNVGASNNVVSDGFVKIDRNQLKKLDDVTSPYSRIQIYEGINLLNNEGIRLMRVNREMHSGTYLDSDELVFKYARYNRLGGHFNPLAKKALLLGGGGYSYAKYFLSDTPLYDREKIWNFDGQHLGNNKTVTIPIKVSFDREKRAEKPILIYEGPIPSSGRAAIEGQKNFIVAEGQLPGKEIIIKLAEIWDTGFDEPNGFVHIHEVKYDGMPGAIISPEYYVNKPRNIIGHSNLISGANQNLKITLDRPVKDGEIIYAMLHRDNGNNRFDKILVDGYEQIESLDVVEIDKATTDLAEKYFNLKRDDPRLRIFHEDGRTYFNRTKDKYDIIYLDAFRNFYNPPYQITTIEATKEIYNSLNDNGVVVVNVPAALRGTFGKFFQAELKTYKQVFPAIKVFAASSPALENEVQNIIMVAFKSSKNIRTTLNDDEAINEQLANEWDQKMDDGVSILTDDFAPTEYYTDAFANLPTF